MELKLGALLKLRDHPEVVLRALDAPLREEAQLVLNVSSVFVPVGDPNDASDLRSTGFVSGPAYNMGPLSTTWFSGYSHPHAAEIHAGWHWGLQTENPPPDFMRIAFKGARARARKAVAKQIANVLVHLCKP